MKKILFFMLCCYAINSIAQTPDAIYIDSTGKVGKWKSKEKPSSPIPTPRYSLVELIQLNKKSIDNLTISLKHMEAENKRVYEANDDLREKINKLKELIVELEKRCK